MEHIRNELTNIYGMGKVWDLTDDELLDLAIANILRLSRGVHSRVEIRGDDK